MRPKSKEELEGLLQAFPDVFRDQVGHDLDVNKVKAIIRDLIKEREDFIIRQRFLDLPPANLREILTMLEPPKVEPETLPKKRGPKPKVKHD